jgi:hypothetical protein
MTAINTMNMVWDFEDQLQEVNLCVGGTAYYVYDAAVRSSPGARNHLCRTFMAWPRPDAVASGRAPLRHRGR